MRMTRSKTAHTAAETGEMHGNVFEALLSGSDDDDGDDSDADEEVEQHYTDCSDCEFDNEGDDDGDCDDNTVPISPAAAAESKTL